MERVNLKARILLPLAGVSISLLLLFFLIFMQEEQDHIAKDFHRSLTGVEAVYSAMLKAHAEKLGAASDAILLNHNLLNALEHNDRKTLLYLSTPLFEQLRKEYQITHFYFHRTDRVNLLRVHQPERYGDLIERHTARLAERSGTPYHGIEIGPLGTFTLRYVTPVYRSGRIIGFIELGEEVDNLVHELSRLFEVHLFALIDKQLLKREEWEEGMELLHRHSAWENLPHYVIASQTLDALPNGLNELFKQTGSTLPEYLEIKGSGRTFNAGFIPLNDTSGATVGQLVLMRDMTDRYARTLQAVTHMSVLASTIGLILLISFYYTLHRAEKRLAESSQQIIDESHAREELQLKHITELEHATLYDSLTDLPNRYLLRERIEQSIKVAEREERSFTLAIFDIARLKEINDTLGHHNGDMVIQQVAKRLSDSQPKGDTVARFSGNEFAVLMPNVERDQTLTIIKMLLATIRRPLEIHEIPIDIDACIGIAVYPDHGSDAATLMQHADTAMHVAKHYHNDYSIYDAENDPHDLERLTLFGQLRSAINGDQLRLHYMPKLDIASGEIRDVEALVRWQHPEQGLVPPVKFIQLAEQTGLIEPLSLWVINEALRQCREWASQGIGWRVAINLSAHNLMSAELPHTIERLLRHWSIEPRRIVLEITESALMENPQHAINTLNRLHAMGVAISIDDFGTGYSSLAYLSRLPAEELKIDQGFVFGLDENPHNATIVQSTIDLAHNLGMHAVAEGIENGEVLELLRGYHCDIVQGYHISKPLPAKQLVEWARKSEWSLAEPA